MLIDGQSFQVFEDQNVQDRIAKSYIVHIYFQVKNCAIQELKGCIDIF